MIRRYNEEDISRIVALEKENLLSSLEEEFYFLNLDNPFAYHYVLMEQEEIIGFVSSIFDGNLLEILNLVIDKKYQSKGYGTRLLKEVFVELMSKGLKRVILEVRESNTKAKALYSSLGFKTISIRYSYYANKENALVMQKEL